MALSSLLRSASCVQRRFLLHTRSSSSCATFVELDGRAVAAAMEDEVKRETRELLRSAGIVPGLAVIMVGDRKDSVRYTQMKDLAARRVGFQTFHHSFAADTRVDSVLKVIDNFNEDPSVHGILVQVPVPSHLPQHTLLSRIRAHKDVDGFHPFNMGCLALNLPPPGEEPSWDHDVLSSTDTNCTVLGRSGTVACTAQACMEILRRNQITVPGKHVVVLGRSAIAGLPITLAFLNACATVTNCARTAEQDMKMLCRSADILVSAVGSPKLVEADWVKPGAVVLDVGTNYVKHDTEPHAQDVVGDVDFETVKERCSFITPVPGGVGPVTVAVLLSNTLRNAKLSVQPHISPL